jgi:hypothetical protein
MLVMNIFAFLPQEAEAESLIEDAMWGNVDISCLDADETPTTLVSDGTYLYIATADSTSPYEASIYRYTDADGCSSWQDTDVYYIYSSIQVAAGDLYWGARAGTPSLAGDIFTFDGTTFSKIARTTWYHAATTDAGWPQSFHEYGGDLFIGGSGCDVNCDALNVNTGEAWAKYYDGGWNWINLAFNSPIVGDILTIEDYGTMVFWGTYDFASVLRYYSSNDTLWVDFVGTDVDGPIVSGTGVYELLEHDGCLQGFTLKMGYNHTLCDTAQTWLSADRTTTDGFVRGLQFRDKIYLGWEDDSTYYIGTFDNDTEAGFEAVFTDSGSNYFLYWAEFDGTLWTTKGSSLYKRNTASAPLVEITSPNQAESTKHWINLIGSVDSTKTVNGCTFLLSSRYYECHEISDEVWAYIDLNTRHIANGKYTLTLQINWSDSTYSKDSIDFFISNSQPTHLDGVEDEYGNIIYLDNPPHKPKWGRTRSEEAFEIVDPYLTVIWDVIDTPSSAASVNLYLPYLTGEDSLTVMSDELHISGINATDRVWLNDTSPVAITDGLGFIYYNLLGSGNSNYTVESECVLTITRTSQIRIVREFNWTKDASTSTWYHQSTFTNEVDSSNTIRNVWFYWSMPKGTTLDQETIHVYDNDNNIELDLSRHFSVDYGGFQLEIDSLSYSSSRSFTLEFQELSGTSSDRIILAIYDNDIQMDSTFAEAPWKFTKTIAQPSSDFEGSIIFAFKTQTPAKSKQINPKSIIIERDGRLIDNWIYEPITDQILLFGEEIEARETAKYEVYFDFEEPLDVVINVAFESILAITLCSLVMIFFSYKPMVDEKEKMFRRIIALASFIGGFLLLIWAVILVV